MSPERLPRDDDSLMSRLLSAGDRDEPSHHTLKKTLVAVGLASTVSSAAGVASASASGLVAVLKWLTLGVVAGASVTVAGGEIADRTRAHRGAREERASLSSVRAELPTVSPGTRSMPVQADAPLEPTASSLAPAVVERKPLPTREPTPSSSATVSADTLTAEASLIERAGSAVRAGNGALAMDALREHRSRFPRGQMYPEAAMLEVQALLLQGQRDSARDAARRFLKAYPASPSAKRLRSLTGLTD